MSADAELPVADRESSAGGLSAVLRGFGALAGSTALSQLIAFAALAYVARRIGSTNLGAYTFALVLATYFGLFASMGSGYLAMREIAQDRASVRSTLRETLILQGVLAVLFFCALMVLAPALVTNNVERSLVPIVGLTLLTSVFTVDWVLFALGNSKTVALWRLVGQSLYGALILIFVVRGTISVLDYAWLNVFGLAVTAAGLAWSLRRLLRAPSPAAPRRLARAQGDALHRVLLRRLRRSLPFGYSLIMVQIYAAVDTLLLGYLGSAHKVGIYAIANKLPSALVLLANIWLSVFFPHAARQLVDDVARFAADLGRVLTAALIVAVALSVAAVMCAGSLLPALFGPAFRAASEPFGFLAVAGALVLLQANFSNVLLAGGGERYFAVTVSVGAAAIVLLDVILIPPYGVNGAAVATVVAEAGLTTSMLVGAVRRTGPISLDIRRLGRGAAAVAVMGLAILASRSVGGAPVQVAAGLVAFFGASLAFRVFDPLLLAQRPQPQSDASPAS
jgi:O-antigen/teichoic acid export membrane protein